MTMTAQKEKRQRKRLFYAAAIPLARCIIDIRSISAAVRALDVLAGARDYLCRSRVRSSLFLALPAHAIFGVFAN